MSAARTRRDFLRGLAGRAAGLGAAFRAVRPGQADEGWKMQYRRLGRTGLMFSEVSLGGHYDGPGHQEKNAKAQEMRNAVVDRALELGVTFFDTNYDYEREQLGIALEGKRERIYLASDVNNDPELDRESTRQNILRQINEHLGMLRTEYVDLFRFMSGFELPSDEQLEGAMDAFKQLKADGKARFFAMSHHEPEGWVPLLRKRDDIDVCYVPFSYITPKAAEEMLPLARERDVGVICIKPFAKGTLFKIPEDDEKLAGLRRDRGQSLARANLKWILSHEGVTTVIPGMELPDEVEDCVRASGDSRVSDAERAALEAAKPHVLAALPDEYGWLSKWRA
ncbi:MAG: aldo/keto reductase [Armatimonadota bacterium]|jgi:aryl-alcohol dehydrogenase-like predicted oxidoreductase